MGKLNTGEGKWPTGWSIPQPAFNFYRFIVKKLPDNKCWESGGMIWRGKNPCTAENKKQLKEAMGTNKVRIDQGTLCGTADPEYSTWIERQHEKTTHYRHPLLVAGKGYVWK